jgi:hypothetical protein
LREDPRKIFFQWFRPTIVLSDRKAVLRYSRDDLLSIEIAGKPHRTYTQGKRVGCDKILRSLARARQRSQSVKP